MKETRNSKVLADFVKYAKYHEKQRFWQCLRNWAKADYIKFVRGTWEEDTYFWELKDEFSKSIDEE